jgi:hypothetical protein
MRRPFLVNGLALKCLFQAALLSLLAGASAYPAPDFTESSWDIVLFLTPIGIIKNLLAASPALRSFYLDISQGQVALSGPQIMFMGIIYILLVWNGLSILRDLTPRQE